MFCMGMEEETRDGIMWGLVECVVYSQQCTYVLIYLPFYNNNNKFNSILKTYLNFLLILLLLLLCVLSHPLPYLSSSVLLVVQTTVVEQDWLARLGWVGHGWGSIPRKTSHHFVKYSLKSGCQAMGRVSVFLILKLVLKQLL